MPTFGSLCGCPVDAVKHLAKKGFIASVERDGVEFETGPNAILLSDLTIQNGRVCNYAEFPALQMLYMQGLIVPGHPNNRGTLPMLIGSRRQVDAQMAYIFRGNYGLESAQELLAAGAPAPLAPEVMRMKRAFAFGHIRPTEELLHRCAWRTRPGDVGNGVTRIAARTRSTCFASRTRASTSMSTSCSRRARPTSAPTGWRAICCGGIIFPWFTPAMATAGTSIGRP